MPAADFIETYEPVLDAATCQRWLARFDASGQAPAARTATVSVCP